MCKKDASNPMCWLWGRTFLNDGRNLRERWEKLVCVLIDLEGHFYAKKCPEPGRDYKCHLNATI